MADSRNLDSDADFDRLLSRGQLLLGTGDLAGSEKVASELVDRYPESTSAFELLGDVYLAMGKSAPARKCYRRALDVEPANADAERKFAAALVAPSVEEQRLQMIRDLVSGSADFRPSARRPLNALLAGLLFPGLGQLYNRQYEKGLGFFAWAAVMLMLLFRAVVMNPWAAVARQSGNQSISFNEQAEQARQILMDMSVGNWALIILGIVAYLATYLYGLYDAYITAQKQAETFRTLGV